MRIAKHLIVSFGLISQVGWATPEQGFYADLKAADRPSGRYKITVEKTTRSQAQRTGEGTAEARAAFDADQIARLINRNSETPQVASQEASPKEPKICPTQEALDKLRYVDLRDLAAPAHNTILQATASQIMGELENNPQQFLSQLESAPGASLGNSAVNALYYPKGAQGPRGETVEQLDVKKSEEIGEPVYKKVYQIVGDDPVHTRQNSILGVEIEEIKEERVPDNCDAAFKMRLLMFVHDKASGYFFRRLWVRFDWTSTLNSNKKKFEILNHVADIPLSETQFKIYGDILDRKVILEDKANEITKVFPIGVGAFDIRTENSMLDFSSDTVFEDAVQVMTFEFEGEYSEFKEAYLKKTTTTMSHSHNTRSRIHPFFYSARPFISIIDKELGYRQIGLHHQIERSFRGFVSHGCIRVRDQDLYQLDAILNEHPTVDRIEASFLMRQPAYAHLEHPLPKIDDRYRVVAYKYNSTGIKGEKVQCKNDAYKVRYVGDFHTVADRDCLTMIEDRSESTKKVLDWLANLTNMPDPYITTSEHEPIIEAQKKQSEAQDNQHHEEQPVTRDDQYYEDQHNEEYKREDSGHYVNEESIRVRPPQGNGLAQAANQRAEAQRYIDTYDCNGKNRNHQYCIQSKATRDYYIDQIYRFFVNSKCDGRNRRHPDCKTASAALYDHNRRAGGGRR